VSDVRTQYTLSYLMTHFGRINYYDIPTFCRRTIMSSVIVRFTLGMSMCHYHIWVQVSCHSYQYYILSLPVYRTLNSFITSCIIWGDGCRTETVRQTKWRFGMHVMPSSLKTDCSWPIKETSRTGPVSYYLDLNRLHFKSQNEEWFPLISSNNMF